MSVTKFSECPNCGHKPGGFMGGSYFKVYKCREGYCGRVYCYHCGGNTCPKCGSRDRREAGEVWKK